MGAAVGGVIQQAEPFTGQLDPHYCAFGSWYGEFIHSEVRASD